MIFMRKAAETKKMIENGGMLKEIIKKENGMSIEVQAQEKKKMINGGLMTLENEE